MMKTEELEYYMKRFSDARKEPFENDKGTRIQHDEIIKIQNALRLNIPLSECNL